jgi:hypothetical protein
VEGCTQDVSSVGHNHSCLHEKVDELVFHEQNVGHARAAQLPASVHRCENSQQNKNQQPDARRIRSSGRKSAARSRPFVLVYPQKYRLVSP